METMVPYPVTPQTQLSHVRQAASSRTATNPAIAQQATRNMRAAEAASPPLSAPASQESIVSVQSMASSVAPRLQSSSSTLSQLTNYTEPTTPTLPDGPPRTKSHAGSTAPCDRTPEDRMNGDYTLVSPMSVTSPVSVNGAKRTASGHVKNAPSLPSAPSAATVAGRKSRTESISSTSSRAGELAATLKSRLGYAMAKVQHGWEHKTIAEVEQLAAHKATPSRHSMSHIEYGKRPSSAGLSSGAAHLSIHETLGSGTPVDGTTSPPSKRRSGNFSSCITSPQARSYAASFATPLQPAADIRPSTNTQHSYRPSTNSQHYYTAPSSQQSHYHNAMSPPRTPVNGHFRRPPTIRTDTQTAEAERDALQALQQLGSPHASQVSRQANASQASSSQASPLRTEWAAPRRVTFARSDSASSRESAGGNAS